MPETRRAQESSEADFRPLARTLGIIEAEHRGDHQQESYKDAIPASPFCGETPVFIHRCQERREQLVVVAVEVTGSQRTQKQKARFERFPLHAEEDCNRMA